MSIKVYNTLTGKKEEFVSVTPGKARIYVCGVTPYNQPHIGNARPFITWDVIHRFLEHEGYDVTHVQNFTDVDDKIINEAKKEGVAWNEIGERYIEAYFTVIDRLNVRRVDIYPKVSDHITEIVTMIGTLMQKGLAYEVEGDVYFSVDKFPTYGELSGRSLEDMQAGARVEVDERKNNPLDFALWKTAKPGEPSWESPWGAGRPGWHIECSVMSMKYLGKEIDFHGGGSDLIFPHHENEIAQLEGCTGSHPFVKYWLHNGFITINQEKMSKSLGNFFLVSDILEHFSGETLRFFILSTHYRSPLDFSDERLQEAARGLERLAVAQENLETLALIPGEGATEASLVVLAKIKECREKFLEALRDDFNTALAISFFFALAREINIYYSTVAEGGKRPDGKLVNSMQLVWQEMCGLIGVLGSSKTEASAEDGLQDALVAMLIELREEARQNKQYGAADDLRDRLKSVGVVLEDTPQGVRWKKNEV